MVVHDGLIDIARYERVGTKGSTKEASCIDGRTFRHIDNSAAGHALILATAIDVGNLSTHQVDDGRHLIEICLGLSLRLIKAQTTIGAGTEHFHSLVIRYVRRIDEHIATLLHQVFVNLTFRTLRSTKHFRHNVADVAVWLEIDESIIRERFGETILCLTYITCIRAISSIYIWILCRSCSCAGIGVILEMRICVVIHTVGTAKDDVHTPLNILCVRGCLQHVGGRIGLRIAMHLV